jgi:hypothetical protein
MTRPTFTRYLFTIISSLAIAIVPATAFAGRGGGGHGGGGGSHGGGGGSRGGGGSSGGAARGGSYAAPSLPSRAYSGSFSRPSAGVNARQASPYAAPAYSGARGGGTVGTVQRPDGQWHAFGNAGGGSGDTAGAQRSFAPSAGSTIPRAPGASVASGRTNSTSRSFSGQGSSIWETTPSTSVVSHSRVLSNIAGSGVRTAGSGISATSGVGASPQLDAKVLSPNGALSATRGPGFAFSSVGIVRPGALGTTGFGVGGHGPICFRCGVGLGFGIGRPLGWVGGWGWGWGSPWLGFGFWDPFWFDPWYNPAFGWDSYGYDQYPPYDYPPYGYDDPNAQIYADPDQGDNSSNANPQQPDAQDFAPPNVTPDSTPNGVRVIHLYMKNGAMVTATDFWIEDGQLHYAIGDAGEISVSLDQLDLQRTVQENAKRGIQFTLKTGPGNSSVAPTPTPNNAPPPPTNNGTNGPESPNVQGTVNRI